MESITLYSTGCPRCNVLEKKLNQKGVSFTVNDSVDEMRELGIMAVPVLHVDGNLLEFTEAVKWVNSLPDI